MPDWTSCTKCESLGHLPRNGRGRGACVKVPALEQAVIDEEKIRDYLLSREHPVGKYKCVVFEALGYSRAEWSQLRDDIRAQHLILDVFRTIEACRGAKYMIQGTLRGPNGSVAEMVSIWIIETGGFRSPFCDHVSGMKFKKLDTIVLNRDLPEQGLKEGDVGAIVHVHSDGSLETEFVTAGGRTHAVVTLAISDARPLAPHDMISVRRMAKTAA